MAKCLKCGRSSLGLRLDDYGRCADCVLSDAKSEALRIAENARAEAEQKVQKEIDLAKTDAKLIVNQAREEADRIVNEAQAERSRVLNGIERERDRLQSDLDRIRRNRAAVVADVNAQLAALFETASKDFAFAAKVAAVREAPKRKYLTIAQFRKAAVNGFVVFDLETTGLDCSVDRIVEIGAIKFSLDGDEYARFHTMVDPGMPIPPSATAVHGITDNMVAGAPRIDAALPDFLAFVGDCPCAAHNAPFDCSFVESAAGRIGIDIGLQVFDTLPASRKTYTLPNHRLGTVARHLGYTGTGTHRSMADCEALSVVVQALIGK